MKFNTGSTKLKGAKMNYALRARGEASGGEGEKSAGDGKGGGARPTSFANLIQLEDQHFSALFQEAPS